MISSTSAYVHYVEGCTRSISSDSLAPQLSRSSSRGGRCRYTIRTESEQRLQPGHQAGGHLRGRDDGWVDEPRLEADDEYPAIWRWAPGRRCSRSRSGTGQHQDAGGKIVHRAGHHLSDPQSIKGRRPRLPRPCSGRKGATNRGPVVRALILDEDSRPIPTHHRHRRKRIGHQPRATRLKIGDEQLFYLMSRSLESEASAMIVSGFSRGRSSGLPLRTRRDEPLVQSGRLRRLNVSSAPRIERVSVSGEAR